MEVGANDLTEGFGEFEEPGYKSGGNDIYKSCTVLGLISLWDEGKIRMLLPYILCQIDVEWIGVVGGFGIPVSAFLFGIDDVAFEDLLMCIDESSILDSA